MNEEMSQIRRGTCSERDEGVRSQVVSTHHATPPCGHIGPYQHDSAFAMRVLVLDVGSRVRDSSHACWRLSNS